MLNVTLSLVLTEKLDLVAIQQDLYLVMFSFYLSEKILSFLVGKLERSTIFGSFNENMSNKASN